MNLGSISVTPWSFAFLDPVLRRYGSNNPELGKTFEESFATRSHKCRNQSTNKLTIKYIIYALSSLDCIVAFSTLSTSRNCS